MGKCTKEQFQKWVDKVYEIYTHDSQFNHIILEEFGKVIVFGNLKGAFRGYEYVGMSEVHDDDTFDERVGIALAYARACGRKVPSCDEVW